MWGHCLRGHPSEQSIIILPCSSTCLLAMASHKVPRSFCAYDSAAGVIAGYEPDFSQPPPKPRRQNLILAALQESRVEEAGFKQAIALIYRRVPTLLFAAINRVVHFKV